MLALGSSPLRERPTRATPLEALKLGHLSLEALKQGVESLCRGPEVGTGRRWEAAVTKKYVGMSCHLGHALTRLPALRRGTRALRASRQASQVQLNL